MQSRDLRTLREYQEHASKTEADGNDTAQRLDRIESEFHAAFDFLSKLPDSVSIFGSTRSLPSSPEYEQARQLAARFVTDKQFAVVTGGGPGIMEAANRGALEAGGISAGLTIELSTGEAVNEYLNQSLRFHYFFARKMALSFAASMYIFFPGGFGTMDEFFELITLVQTRKIERIPIFCIGTSYWQPLRRFMEHYMLHPDGYITEADLGLFTITDDLDLVLECAKYCQVRH
ncbi:MAG: hypothetical protein QG658_48 [Patescibacteria group bacterium]|jgi:uncharacterized protein (TIGR00730 family)|nr:hypothetical protein [Patescibacteria group bacterium]